MDPLRFDRISRALAAAAPRRGTLLALLAGVLPAVIFDDEVDAKRRRGKHRAQHENPSSGRRKADRKRNERGRVEPEKKKKKKKKVVAPPPPPPTDTCPGGTTRCGGACVHTASDASNCGSCGAACAAGQSCQGGACTCNGERCAGCCDGTTCRDGASEAQCGVNGSACLACGEGQTCCNGACRDLSSDMNHCGTCGNACPSDGANECVEGVCKCFGRSACTGDWRCCPAAQTGAGCYLVTHTIANCGACDNRCDAQTANRCTGGVCTCNGVVCTGSETCCNGVCRSTFNDPLNCGACNTFCPGLTWPTVVAGCPNGTCTFGCKGQNYDVNGDPSDGCEREDTQANRTQATAKDLGSFSCRDTDAGSFTGTIYSDGREHTNPEPAGFNPDTGAAPLWFWAFADGGACQNDPAISLSMTGGTSGCYTLTFKTNLGTEVRTVTNGAASIVLPSSSYSDDTPVYFKVEKTCGKNVREAASFTVNFHL